METNLPHTQEKKPIHNPPLQHLQLHLIFPKEFQSHFTKLSINIHHPKNTIWWEKKDRMKKIPQHRQQWQTYMSTPKTRVQTLKKGFDIVRDRKNQPSSSP